MATTPEIVRAPSRKTLEVFSLIFMVGSLIASLICLYYTTLDYGNEFTDWLDKIRKNRAHESLVGLRLLLLALPAYCIALGISKTGRVTTFGKRSIWLLGAVFVLSTLSTLLLQPASQSPSSLDLAVSISRLSTYLSGTSLTVILAILGFKLLEKSE